MEHRADWSRFHRLTYIAEISLLVDRLSVHELADYYSRHLLNAARLSIPLSSGTVGLKKVPLWNAQCASANAQRKHSLRKYQRSLLVADKVAYCRARAVAKRVKLEARRSSWEDYVNTLTLQTPMAKIWKLIGKIMGVYQNVKPPCHIKNNVHVTDPVQIAVLMAHHYETVSGNGSYPAAFQRIRERMEHHLCFDTSEVLPYNSPITYLSIRNE